MGIIKGICISKERGTEKHEVEEAGFVKDWGIQGDAHAGKCHRQVSLVSFEKIEEFRAKGADVAFGAFGENLIVEGYDFKNLPVGTRFRCGKVLLEMTQIGKECHSHCQIYQRNRGRCYKGYRSWRGISEGSRSYGGTIGENLCRSFLCR